MKGATPRRGCRRRSPRHFNPRSREGSDTSTLRSPGILAISPRSREGSDVLPWLPILFLSISIHAPVKGATGLQVLACGHVDISIHAPVKGATVATRILAMALAISIHAPVKGATTELKFSPETPVISIHAPVKGATSSMAKVTANALFQSTLP